MSRVAVVGLGAMGSRMARRLLEAGHDLVVWNRTPEKAAALVEAGAEEAPSPGDAARRADFVITMLADAEALRAVVEGEHAIAARLGAGATLVDMSTVGPDATAWLAETLPPGARLLDAPVLGSLPEAESGELTIFAGGPAELVAECEPLLEPLGTVLHVGPLGSGQRAKLVANATLVTMLTALGEALALADGLGLSREGAFRVLAETPLAAQAERRRPAIETGEFPRRFGLSLARKDADLIAEAGAAAHLDLRVIDAARSWFREAEAAGSGEEDYSAVLAVILRLSSR